MNKKIRDHNDVAQWMRANNMREQIKAPGVDGDILLADSESAFFSTENDMWIYRTGFCIQRGKYLIATTAEYPLDHNPELTPAGRKQFRLGEALTQANERMAQLRSVGYYDAPRAVFTPPKSYAERERQADAMVARILEKAGHG